MEIGGYDTIIPTNNPTKVIKEIMNFVEWENAVIECDEIDSFFWYRDEEAKKVWDEGIEENTMIYFIPSRNSLTVVTDKELTDKIRTFVYGKTW